MEAKVMWFSRRVAYLAALVLVGCNGGGGGDDDDDTSVPAPQNVSATAGYETATLTWDPVADATGYRVWIATSPGAPLSGITPVDIAAPPLVESNLTNWQTRYYRVTALVGAHESLPSAEVYATPEGGYLVTERSPGGIYVYRSDAIELGPIEEIANGQLGRSFGSPRQGITWLVRGGATAPKADRIGVFRTSTPLVLGEEAGHVYEFIDMIPTATPRLAWVDCASGTCGVSTSLLDGTDVRSIISGCTDVSAGFAKVSTQGIAIRCTDGAVHEWWYSDGVAPAFELLPNPGLSLDPTRTLEALLPQRAIFRHPNELHLTSQALAPSSTEVHLIEADQASIQHEVLTTADGTRRIFNDYIAVRRYNGTQWSLLTLNANAEPGSPEFDLDYEITLTGASNVPAMFDASPDGTRLLALLSFQSANDEIRGYTFGNGGGADPDFTSTDDALEARFAADGMPVIRHLSDGWRVFDWTGTAGAQLTSSYRYEWAGTRGSFVYLYGPGGPSVPKDFLAAKTDGVLYTISDDAVDPQPTLRGDGELFFVDTARNAYSSIYDPTSNLFERFLIDEVDSLRVEEAGDGPGNRTFLVMTRYTGGAPHKDLVVFDVVNRSSPAVPLLAEPTVSESGFFVPE